MADDIIKFQLATFNRVGGYGFNDLNVTDIRNLQKRLKAIDPTLRTALVRDAKAVAAPTVSAIKTAIGSVTPNSGMLRPGTRLNWNNAIDAKGRSHSALDVKPQFRTSMSGRSDRTSLVRVKVGNPAVALADMGGRSGRYINAGYKGSGFTREYAYKGGTRRHRVNGQFRGVTEKIGGSASRFVWPAAERSLPAARDAIEKILRNAYTRINSKGI
jgi:hypothetical protein